MCSLWNKPRPPFNSPSSPISKSLFKLRHGSLGRWCGCHVISPQDICLDVRQNRCIQWRARRPRHPQRMIKVPIAVVSETWKRVQPGCGPQGAPQIHPALLDRGQFSPCVHEAPALWISMTPLVAITALKSSEPVAQLQFSRLLCQLSRWKDLAPDSVQDTEIHEEILRLRQFPELRFKITQVCGTENVVSQWRLHVLVWLLFNHFFRDPLLG